MRDGYANNVAATEHASAIQPCDYDRAIASLANAPLIADGWRIALRDIAALLGRRRRASLMIADTSADAFEYFGVECPEPGAAIRYTHKTAPKARAWALAHQRQPKPIASIISTSPDDAAATGPLLTQFLERPANDALVASIDIAGIQGLLCLYDEPDAPGFSADDRHNLTRLRPTLERAAIAHAKLGGLRTRLTVCDHFMDQLPFGLLILDRSGGLLDANAAGQRLLAGQSILRLKKRFLQCVDGMENQTLQVALAEVLKPGSKTASHRVLKLYGIEEAKPWSLSISALPAEQREASLAWGSDRAWATVCISDRDPITKIRAGQIALVYGLSPQEESLSARVASGDNLARIAKDTGRSIETLRTQLRAVFQKIEVNSQAELVQLVLSAPVGFLPDRAADRVRNSRASISSIQKVN